MIVLLLNIHLIISRDTGIPRCFRNNLCSSSSSDSEILCISSSSSNEITLEVSSSSSSSSSEIGNCDLRAVVKSILFIENASLQDLISEVKGLFLTLKAESKKLLSAINEEILSGSLSCLDTLENSTVGSVIDSFNGLIPLIKEIVDNGLLIFETSNLDFIAGTRIEMNNYIVFLQAIALPADLQTLVRNNLIGPYAVLNSLLDSVVSNSNQLISQTSISIMDKISAVILGEKEQLIIKLSRFFNDAVDCITNSINIPLSKANTSFEESLKKQGEAVVNRITKLIGCTEQQILFILYNCFPTLANKTIVPQILPRQSCLSPNPCNFSNSATANEIGVNLRF